ncbi:hypothetical protein K6959_08670 [Bacillus aquiflavi]|uniref:MGDG synthase family glycosyltransferase n=1 Tax=Bacillus aquiflavi TaxID=2672567 RepID=UPI001CA913F2|nr:hypothetical protein [Bacillus aquiflavi]UAC49827.1 hypothetical protein K6959_08670 [Bacillus aquiflavi]
MRKILILPFLQMPSGHHQVADALSTYLKAIDNRLEIKKVDIFHYTSRLAEQASTYLYLKAIKLMPSVYGLLYRYNACRVYETNKRYFFYEQLFLKRMKKLIVQENPDIIICTHCLPSYLLNLLKRNGYLSVPVINAYTDYFINTVWGISDIDLHLAPSDEMKHFLESRAVSPEKIAVTGIPVHPHITQKMRKIVKKVSPFHVLVSGGHLGVGLVEKLFDVTNLSGKIKYFVLCGKNQKLFRKITSFHTSILEPISYISSRPEMNRLYEQMDLVLSKPGWITISECFQKELPLCLLKALPGQEEWNRHYLLKEKLTIPIVGEQMEKSLLLFLEDEKAKQQFQQRLSAYVSELENINVVLQEFLIKH